MFTGKQRKNDGERGITCGDRPDQRELANFEGAVKREHGESVDGAGENSPSPGLPARAVEEVAPVMREQQKDGDEHRAQRLHPENRAQTAERTCGEARQKIRAAPGHRGGDTEQNAGRHLFGLGLFYFEAEFGHDPLQVFPDITLGGGIAQQIGGVISSHHFVSAVIEPFAAEMRDAAIGLQQSLRRGGPETDDYFRPQHVQLAKQKWRASFDFVFFRLTISRRTAFYDVADVHVAALQAHGFDHLGQKFSGTADEWQSLGVFVRAWSFADKNELRGRAAVAENNFVAGGVQLAAGTFAEVSANDRKRVAGDPIGGCEEVRSGRCYWQRERFSGRRRSGRFWRGFWQSEFLFGDGCSFNL